MQFELSIEEALKRADLAYIDVRSPFEFALASIPGAVNIPLFDDQQRRELGAIYQEAGEAKARRLALEFAAPKLPALLQEIEQASGERLPLLYCWRGGLRSLSVFQIMHLAGISALRLKGGYRSYRRYINQQLVNFTLTGKLLVLQGLTGVGKTAVIQELIRRGLPALDLENAARHRGSVFGSVGLAPQRSQKDFEALLLEQLKRFSGAHFIAVEGEGRRIGNVHLPPFLAQAMAEGHRVLLVAPVAERVQRIAREYLPAAPSAEDLRQIRQALDRLSRYLGAQQVEKLHSLLHQESYYAAAEMLCLEYYDRLYAETRVEKERFLDVIDTSDLNEAVNRVSALLKLNPLTAASV